MFHQFSHWEVRVYLSQQNVDPETFSQAYIVSCTITGSRGTASEGNFQFVKAIVSKIAEIDATQVLSR